MNQFWTGVHARYWRGKDLLRIRFFRSGAKSFCERASHNFFTAIFGATEQYAEWDLPITRVALGLLGGFIIFLVGLFTPNRVKQISGITRVFLVFLF